MQLHIFQGLDEQGNILIRYSKFCKRPKATIPYKHLMELLEKDKIYMIQIEPTETYCSF